MNNYTFNNAGGVLPRRLRQILLVMRMTTLILLVSLLQVSASGLAQKISIDKKNTSIQAILNEIGKQSGYDFFYDANALKNIGPVSIIIKNSDLKDAVRLSLEGLPLSFTIGNKTVVIKEKEDSFLDRVVTAFANIDVRGKVLGENDQVLEGAMVRIKGSARTVTTNEKGIFFFPGVADDAVLVITYVGYETKELKAEEGMEIVLVTAMTKLDEVVVSTGYQQLKKSNATGSYSVVTANDIAASPVLNLMERLNGLVPGVSFDTRDNHIQIRTPNNFGTGDARLGTGKAAQMPLIVVDGFPIIENKLVDNPGTALNGTSNWTSNNAILNSINPDDIEDITFLKDAAATSIWGSQAANGVVVIQTKRGHAGKARLGFSTTLSTTSPADLGNLKRMNSSDYIELEKELFDLNFFQDPAVFTRSYPVSDAVQYMFDAKNGKISNEERDAALAVLAGKDSKAQLRDVMLQKAVTQQYNLTLTGSGVSNAYYFSGNYSKDRPVFKGNFAGSYSIFGNIDQDFFKNRLRLGLGFNMLNTNSEVNDAAMAALTQGQYGIRPYDNLIDENGQPVLQYIKYSKKTVDGLTGIGFYPWTYNAVAELENSYTRYRQNNSRVNAKLTGVMTNWLNVELSGSMQKSNEFMNDLAREHSYEVINLVNEGTTFLNSVPTYGVPRGAILRTSNTMGQDYNIRIQFNVDKTFHKDHHLILIAGNNFGETKTDGYTQTYYGYDEDAGTATAVNPTTPYTDHLGFQRELGYKDGAIYRPVTRQLSYFGNANYSYKDLFTFSGSLRFDDYTQIGLERKKRARPFWSAGTNLNLKSLFMKRAEFLDVVSLRFSAGTGGKIPVNGNAFPIYASTGTDPKTILPYGTISMPGNQELGWETTRQMNTGIDLQMLNGRLGLTLDLYDKRSYGILVSLPINPTYGWRTLTYNTANMKSNGFDAGLSGTVIRSKDWGWDMNLNFSYNTTMVTDQRFNTTENITSLGGGGYTIKGYPVDLMLAYKWAGLDQNGQPLVYNSEGIKVGVNDYNNALTFKDFVDVGRSSPPYLGGFIHNFRYRQFNLSAKTTYQFGHKLFYDRINTNTLPNYGSSSGFLSASKDLVNRWKKPGDELSTNIPGLLNFTYDSNIRYSYADINVIAGDNIRLDMLSLGYTFPKSVLQHLRIIEQLNLSLTVSNLGLIWKKTKEDLDPYYIFTNKFTSLRPAPNYLFNLGFKF